MLEPRGGGEAFAAACRRNDGPEAARCPHAHCARAVTGAAGAAGAGVLALHDLVESFARGDHPQFAAGALFERRETGLEVRHFGAQLPIALGLLQIGRALRLDGRLQSRNLAQSFIREPESTLEQDQCDGQ